MKVNILIAWLCLLLARPLLGQEDTLASSKEGDNIYTATPKSTHLIVDIGMEEELKLVLKKIHNYRYLENITFEGEGNEIDIKKVFYRLSALRNITSITFKENNLLKMPENISGLKFLQALTIEGSIDLDYTDLCTRLKSTQITELNLIDNDLKIAPATLSEVTSLRRLKISGSNQMDYEDLVERLSKIPGLTTLSIPLNYLTDLPRNLGSLQSLRVLDVSNNDLIEIPSEVSALKTINDLSIQGNLLLNPVKDLEKLKDNKIRYLAMDREISGEELEQIKKLFPEAVLDFPVSKEIGEIMPGKDSGGPAEMPVYSGELKVKKEITVLSGAYLSYPAFFQGLTYNFDTLRFEERYASTDYENGRRIVRNDPRRIPVLYLRRSCKNYEKPGKKDEIWFRFATDDPFIVQAYPELRAFGGMYWVYKGNLTRKQFDKRFLKQRSEADYMGFTGRRPLKRKKPVPWNDVRIEFQKNNNLFSVTLKSDTGYATFTAYPLFSDMTVERSRLTYDRRYLLYNKSLLRRAQRFNRSLARARRNYDLNFKNLNTYAWKEMQVRMSDEEKLMKKEEWLEYYDNLIADEKKALDKTSLAAGYITRSLSLRGYTVTNDLAIPVANRSARQYGVKQFNADIVDSKSGRRLPVATIFVIDKKNRTICQSGGSLGLAPNVFSVTQFASQFLLVELRNGNWGFVSADQLDKQTYEVNKVLELSAEVFDKNLNTIGDLLKDAIE